MPCWETWQHFLLLDNAPDVFKLRHAVIRAANSAALELSLQGETALTGRLNHDVEHQMLKTLFFEPFFLVEMSFGWRSCTLPRQSEAWTCV